MAKILPFTQGVNGAYVFPLLNAEGTAPAPIPVGYTVKAQIRSSENVTAPLLAELTGSIINGDSVMISWTDAESRTWMWDNGYMDVILRDDSGHGVKIVWKGKTYLSKVVTSA